MNSCSILVSFILLISTLGLVSAGENTYSPGDPVPVFMTKVGPFFNPSETYDFYSLPFCAPEPIVYKKISLGQQLTGSRQASSKFNLRFKENIEHKLLCDPTLSKRDIADFRDAIEELYFFEFSLDDLPLWGSVGHLEEQAFPHVHNMYLWTHYHFYIEYNDNKIIYANVTMDTEEPIKITETMPNKNIEFTYSVVWVPTTTKYSDRLKRYSQGGFFPEELEVHWLSIINSASLVIMLTGVVAIILMRVLRADFARYSHQDEDMEEEAFEDSGWKVIHGDVFRFPAEKTLFCAILGTGAQFVVLSSCILMMALFGMFNIHNHGSMNSASIFLYAFTCIVSGYISGSFFKKIGGTNWVWNIMLTASLFSVPFFIIWSIINSVAWAYESTQALPFSTIFLIICVWVFIGFPLTVVGGIIGKNNASSFDAPCRTKNIPREIPTLPWHRSPATLIIAGGFLPFSSISIELYYIFNTLWGRQTYTLFGILSLMFIILLLVTACMSIALTYYMLSSEDYRWWWRSIFNSGSTGFFVFFYGIFYYVNRSNMSGALQTAKFFGYTFISCYIFFLMLGSVGFFVSLQFVRYIFKSLKAD